MAKCLCINGHTMWDGNGKPTYYAFRFNFFKKFSNQNPSFLLNSADYTEIYDCYDIPDNKKEEFDC